jgi:hypothetical protein
VVGTKKLFLKIRVYIGYWWHFNSKFLKQRQLDFICPGQKSEKKNNCGFLATFKNERFLPSKNPENEGMSMYLDVSGTRVLNQP